MMCAILIAFVVFGAKSDFFSTHKTTIQQNEHDYTEADYNVWTPFSKAQPHSLESSDTKTNNDYHFEMNSFREW